MPLYGPRLPAIANLPSQHPHSLHPTSTQTPALLPHYDPTPCHNTRKLTGSLPGTSACGGGSGGGGGTPGETTPKETTTPCVQTHDHGCISVSAFEERAAAAAEAFTEQPGFANQWGLQLRYGSGEEPGTGVTVGVLDTGIDQQHPQFRNKPIPETHILGAVDEVGTGSSHGTAVASVIAGQDSPELPTDAPGVAPGADLVVFALPPGRPSPLYEPGSLAGLSRNNALWTTIFDTITSWRQESRTIDFLNLSFGNPGILDNYSEPELRQLFGPAIAAMAQKDLEEKIILVWAAGNANGRDCTDSTPQCVGGKVNAESVEVLAGLAARIPELRSHTVSVVSVREEDGAISDFSNRCGIAADYCLAAPGENVRVAYFGRRPDTGPGTRDVATWDGTSFAAPMVTGGLALMKQYFRDQLSNTDLLARLLRTADRTGQYADAAIYGRGLLDLGAATTPVGSTAIALGSRVDGPGTALESSGLRLGTAFGDGLASALDGRQIAAFDTLGAPFWYDLDDFASATPRPSLSERLRGFQRAMGDGSSFSLLDLPPASHGRTPHLRLSDSGTSSSEKTSHLAFEGPSLIAVLPAATSLTATAVTTDGIAGQAPASGAALSWRPPDALLGLRASWIRADPARHRVRRRFRFPRGASCLHRDRRECGIRPVAPRRHRGNRLRERAAARRACQKNLAPGHQCICTARQSIRRGWQRMALVPLAAAPHRKRACASGCSHGPNESRERGSQRPVRRSRAKRPADRPGASMVAAAQSRGSSRGGHPVPPAGPSQERDPGVDASLGLATLVLNSPRAPAPPQARNKRFRSSSAACVRTAGRNSARSGFACSRAPARWSCAVR